MDVSDLNRDGHMDLIPANQGNLSEGAAGLRHLLGLGPGYRADRLTELPTMGRQASQAADLSQDGLTDLLFGNTTDSAGRDARPRFSGGGPDGFAAHRRSELLRFGVIGCGVADLNRDGKPDILLVSHLSGTGVPPFDHLLGSKDHYYSSAATVLLDPGGEMEYSVADLDDDDYPDLVLMQEGRGTVW